MINTDMISLLGIVVTLVSICITLAQDDDDFGDPMNGWNFSFGINFCAKKLR